jgi:ribonuclease G
MIEKVKKLLGLPTKSGGGIRLIVNAEKLEKRVAVLEEGQLEEYNVERVSDRNIVGSIYKGRVKNIEQGLKAMFVDIGFEKNAFLHFWDAIPAALDSGIEEVRRNTGKNLPKKITAKDIPTIYPPGSDIMVQVSKGPIGTKGPRITTNISMPGRYLVLMPYSPQCGISRKIDDPKERERLRKILNELEIPDGMGVIIRTVGAGQRSRFFVRDLHLLLEQWAEIEKGMETERGPSQLFEEPDLVERTVRDFLTDEVEAVICDDLHSVERMQALVAQVSPRSKKRIQFYNEEQHIFEKYGVDKQVEKAFHRQVWLKCGGYIVIDETEALISVDVNTGRNKGGKDVDKTIFQTNLEAVDEVARQMRLRNIGGLIVADLIDMKSRKDQQAVYLRMRQRLKRDKARTHVLPISPLGLMEMTRQRAAESMRMSQFDPCPYCEGRGLIKNTMTMSVELQRALHSVMRKNIDSIHEIKVIVNPDLLQRLRTEDEELLVDIERRYGGRLSFKPDPTMHREKFTITDANTGAEITA